MHTIPMLFKISALLINPMKRQTSRRPTSSLPESQNPQLNSTTGSAVAVTGANVEKIPGLNTLSVSLARIDYAPGGLNPPHTHPRATEVVYVLEGELEVRFITTANKLFSKTIMIGEVFVFPRVLVHFQKNNGESPASVLSAFNSQLPGTVSVAASLFATDHALPEDVLTKTQRWLIRLRK
ncbi:hypothetical protein F2Q70_00042203 [Brassica cretica]|uniref:Germin-like protein n=1 Tax=Brassica cretica TaxID=69181 RepID=A0A8S9K5B8_BRACR|nr:hypothetical protein F2Q70_00042203 [Brassica cretica]KAF2620498.1 hypothetical protein F2Q68_00042866 [Brassica cretica]